MSRYQFITRSLFASTLIFLAGCEWCMCKKQKPKMNEEPKTSALKPETVQTLVQTPPAHEEPKINPPTSYMEPKVVPAQPIEPMPKEPKLGEPKA